MKGKSLKEKGITLIALVITIIVLLILAGVTLNILINSGILDNSQKAVDIYKEQQAKEKLDMAKTDYQLSQLSPETAGKTFEKAVEEVGGTATHNDETKEYDVEIDDLTFKVSDETLGKKEEEEKTPKIEDGDNLEGTKNGTLTGEEPSYKNPVIPVGFKTKDTEDAKWETSDEKTVDDWNEGLVIEDDDHNEFVWVPAYVEEIDGEPIDEEKIEEYTANKIPKYEKWLGSTNSFIITKITDVSNDTLPMLEKSATQDQIKACEEEQIEKYGGFYIGRYEAGTELEYNERNKKAIPIVKQNQKPWNLIDYNNAKASAESMYTTNKVQSLLVTGTMWDTVMKWLKNNDVNVQTKTEDTAWGNYFDVDVTGVSGYYGDSDGKNDEEKMTESNWKNATIKPSGENDILKTGESEFTKKKNIYDLAGNMWEWTNEIYSNDSSWCVERGGDYTDSALGCNATSRSEGLVSETYMGRSFRVGLYIK